MLKSLTRDHFRPFVVALTATLTIHFNAEAEQVITLQSGTVLVGQITMEGENLNIQVDGANLQVPLQEVATITSTKSDSGKQAQRLLFKGIESQLLFDGDRRALGIFTEAYRLSPDNPSVAFWHARSLANAGYGKAANKILETHRKEIVMAYPAMVDRLAKQIEHRIALEALPAELVKRLDILEARSNGGSSPHGDQQLHAAYFQLVDQNNKPVDSADFRVSCDGNNENLESFSDGFHLFTFHRRHTDQTQPCRVELKQVGMSSDSFEFRASHSGVANVGIFTVRRFTEEDRRKVEVLVSDSQGKPLAHATVTFHPTQANQSRNHRILPIKTDNTGLASSKLMPEKYNCVVASPGYVGITKLVQVTQENQELISLEVKLYRQIAAKVKIIWRSKPRQSSRGQRRSGEQYTFGDNEMSSGILLNNVLQSEAQAAIRWLRLQQKTDKLKIYFFDQQARDLQASGNTWIGRLPGSVIASDGNEKALTKEFEAIDLKEVDKLKDQVKELRLSQTGRQPLFEAPVELGAIYVGKIFSTSPQNGRPILVDFKMQVLEVHRPDKPQ